MRKLVLLMISLILVAGSCFATAQVYLRPAFFAGYETNVFSDPLPQYTVGGSYIQRTGVGFTLNTDFFFKEDSRTGLSLSFMYSHPVQTDAWTTANLEENPEAGWVFADKPSLYFALGPVFRADLDVVELGIAIRASVGSVNLFENSVNLGVQFEPYILVPLVSEHWMFNAGLIFDAHFYDFLLDSVSQYYRTEYFMMTLGGYVGITYRWGQ